MYKLLLADGTEINNLCRLNPNTFEINSNDSSIYWLLSDKNLAFATLYKDGELEEIILNSKRASYSMQNGLIHFRIIPISGVK